MTNAQIRQLRSEAREAQDESMVRLCDLALEGDETARAQCDDARCDHVKVVEEMAEILRGLASEAGQWRSLFVARFGRAAVEECFAEAVEIVEAER